MYSVACEFMSSGKRTERCVGDYMYMVHGFFVVAQRPVMHFVHEYVLTFRFRHF